MIDFRYHLVSLVSVFLALAVGIVLGAGPLKESIGDTLSGQVDSLRVERNGLRQDLERSGTALAHRDEFITAVTPELVADQLGGRHVVLVTLPGALTDDVKPLKDALGKAGAVVTGRISVQDSWNDPDGAEDRDRLLTRLATLVGADDHSAGSLDALLARALVTDDIAASGVASPVGSALLTALSDEGLIKVDDAPTGRATQAVVLAPPVVTDGGDATPSPTTSSAGASDVSAWSSLAVALDQASDGAVVYGPASSAGDGGTIAKIRSDSSASQDVSSVDTGGTSMGPPTTVLALREQLHDQAGAYGFGAGAKAPLPDLSEEGS